MLTASIIGAMLEAVSTSETSNNFYEPTRRNIPEDSLLHKVFIYKPGPCEMAQLFIWFINMPSWYEGIKQDAAYNSQET
jgi:hypothetical protein